MSRFCKKCEGFGYIYVFVSDEHVTEDQYWALPEDQREFCDKKECDRCEGNGDEPEEREEDYGGLDYCPIMAIVGMRLP